jgi:hypothetical protein
MKFSGGLTESKVKHLRLLREKRKQSLKFPGGLTVSEIKRLRSLVEKHRFHAFDVRVCEKMIEDNNASLFSLDEDARQTRKEIAFRAFDVRVSERIEKMLLREDTLLFSSVADLRKYFY